ncbi:hypothetical protein [Cellulomonas pakistanensis]|uniref:Uncharacterized protein n=1 Tax=Cellulomonas pakistanensis TaxID=992287 RepID=A0A919P9P5_9CELL|nr:hypothetical protein [Cellulomonas pakistanensis]GIG34969.1 hypothetical protein Cpa01nite_03500 [Cellulomonas pakistanensis]
MAQDRPHRLDDDRARQRAALLARRSRARTRLPLDVALRLAMDPAAHAATAYARRR